MTISREQVQHVANLSRLAFSGHDLERIGVELSKIIDYVNKLAELDTEGVEPTAHALPIVNVFREDVARPSLPQGEALANAPDRHGEFFRVPRIVDTEEADSQ
ncbi:MAG: Asp-tRNA(Asn)/Glu-tRNA(Gln) amidotransferase subunit GatC [Firmicutes bacterium]|nr:Asp-tRNA(Asn)/Glu-tRNA(Gln) amidotransferase subunit GatC [Bacillota bacterium]